MAPDVTRTNAKAEGDTILHLLQLLNEFDSGDHDFGVLEGFKAQHRGDAEFHATVILLNGLITNDKFCLSVVSPLKLGWVRGPRAGVGVRADSANLTKDVRQPSIGEHAKKMAD